MRCTESTAVSDICKRDSAKALPAQERYLLAAALGLQVFPLDNLLLLLRVLLG